MALIQAARQSSGGSGHEVLSAQFNVTYTEEFTAGTTITIPGVGSGILLGTLTVNYMEKLLLQGNSSFDYTFTGPDTITLNFGDDPTQYANGEIILQISYAYNA